MPPLDDLGREIPDPTPVAVPVGFTAPESLEARILRILTGHLSRQLSDAGGESLEDANDFEIGDDYDPRSEYEIDDLDPVIVEKPVDNLGTTGGQPQNVPPPPLDKAPPT